MTGKMFKFAVVVLVLGAALALGACAPSGSTGINLDGTNWKLNTLNGVFVPRNATLGFAGGKISGNSGCNSFGGGYNLDGDKLKLTDPLASTLMACEGDAMDLEAKFLGALQAEPTVSRQGNQLTLTAPDGTALVFMPSP